MHKPLRVTTPRSRARSVSSSCDFCRADHTPPDYAECPKGKALAATAIWHYNICHMANSQVETTSAVATLLGGKKVLKRDIAERDELREVVRQGFPFRALETFAHTTRIPIALIAKVLGLAPRTLARRKDQRLFTAVESDRLYRLARLASTAVIAIIVGKIAGSASLQNLA